MTNCDICGLEVLPGQPRYGLVVGARHWDCEKRERGYPAPAEPVRPSPPPPPRRKVRTPNVRRGPTNYSDNAARQWATTGRAVSEMGRRRIEIECPFCWQTFWAFVWSLAGGGKRCPNCQAMHTSHGSTYPIEGNEDL